MRRESKRLRGQPLWIWILVGVVTPAVSLMRILDDGPAETAAAAVGLIGIAVGSSLLVIDVQRQRGWRAEPSHRHIEQSGVDMSDRESKWGAPPGSLKPRNFLLGAAIPLVILGIAAAILLL